MTNSTGTPARSSHIAPSVNAVPLLPSSEDRTWIFSNHPDPPFANNQLVLDAFDDTSPTYIRHVEQPVLEVRPGFSPPHMEVEPQVQLMRGWGARIDRGTGVVVQGVRRFLQRRHFGRWLRFGTTEPQHALGGAVEHNTEPTRYKHTCDAVIEVPNSFHGS